MADLTLRRLPLDDRPISAAASDVNKSPLAQAKAFAIPLNSDSEYDWNTMLTGKRARSFDDTSDSLAAAPMKVNGRRGIRIVRALSPLSMTKFTEQSSKAG